MIRTSLRKLLGRSPAPAARQRNAFRPQVEALEIRLTPTTRTVLAGGSIQTAVNASAPGDTINVMPGTYFESVTIGAGKNNLTLHSTTLHSAVVKSPGVNTDVLGIFIVRGATNVTIDGFDISGPGLSGNSHALESGILIDNAGSATITNNIIENITDTPLSGSQDGVGIAVGATYTHNDGVPFLYGRATIYGNTIRSYQKGGVFVDGFNSFATVGGTGAGQGNTIIGQLGGTALLAEFGVQVSNRAGADIEGNTISNNQYTGPGFDVPSFAAGFGIVLASLTSGRPGSVIVNANSISTCDEGIRTSNVSLARITNNVVEFCTGTGIDLFSLYGSRVTGNSAFFNAANASGTGSAGDGIAFSGNSFLNTVSGNVSEFNAHDGLFFSATTHDNTVTGNTMFINGNFDAEDLSVGSFPSGTANNWFGNTFGTQPLVPGTLS